MSARSVGPPTPYRDARDYDVSAFFRRMTLLLKPGYAITDLKGLELMAHLLFHLENYRSNVNNRALSISLPLALRNLSEMVGLLKEFQPMFLETTSDDVARCQSLNFEHCYGVFLDYIDMVATRLLVLVKVSSINTSRSSFLLNLERIKFYVAHVKDKLTDKFSGHSTSREENYWDIVTDYKNSIHVPEVVSLILKEFPEHHTPLPPWTMPVNSAIVTKIWQFQEADLKASAVNGSCGYCHRFVSSICKMSVLPHCNHVYCFPCLKYHFDNEENNQWSCPACGRAVTEYAVISCGTDSKSISFLVPPHQRVVAVGLRTNALSKLDSRPNLDLSQI